MEFIEDPRVTTLLKSYPDKAKQRLLELRELIITIAKKTEAIDKLVETTKWGEPSYMVKRGSTIRMDWKAKTPDNYYLFFICSTELVSTFKVVNGEELTYEGNRAIVLKLDEDLPKIALEKCISLAFNYHNLKHLPLLGQ